jgi:DNA excision repair protein ERCC-2
LQFSALAEAFGPHSLFDITKLENGHGLLQQNCTLNIRNVVPAIFLKKRFSAANSSTLFSATLSPSSFYSDMLGLPERTPFLEVESPFSADQLQVRIASHINTRFRKRAASYAPIVELMAQQYLELPGNYMLFLSSFEYLQKVKTLFQRDYPDIPIREQIPSMNENEREAFINSFTHASKGIAFAVLGGSFGEAIDLPGDRLIGAFIATLGLPQINEVNEQMRSRMEAIFGLGYEYTYLYPGLQKVVQAAGRVIRTATDHGTIYLIDDRYSQPDIQALLPSWWTLD